MRARPKVKKRLLRQKIRQMKLERGQQPEGRSDHQPEDPAPDEQQDGGAGNNVETGPAHIVLVTVDFGGMLRRVDVRRPGLAFSEDRVRVFLLDLQLMIADRPDKSRERKQ